MRRKDFTEKETERMKNLHLKGYSPARIAERLQCSENTINNYIFVFSKGFENSTEYMNTNAREAGFLDANHRYSVMRLMNKSKISKQEKFERGMKKIGTMRY